MLAWFTRQRARRLGRFAELIRRRQVMLLRPQPGVIIREALGLIPRARTLVTLPSQLEWWARIRQAADRRQPPPIRDHRGVSVARDVVRFASPIQSGPDAPLATTVRSEAEIESPVAIPPVEPWVDAPPSDETLPSEVAPEPSGSADLGPAEPTHVADLPVASAPVTDLPRPVATGAVGSVEAASEGPRPPVTRTMESKSGPRADQITSRSSAPPPMPAVPPMPTVPPIPSMPPMASEAASGAAVTPAPAPAAPTVGIVPQQVEAAVEDRTEERVDLQSAPVAAPDHPVGSSPDRPSRDLRERAPTAEPASSELVRPVDQRAVPTPLAPPVAAVAPDLPGAATEPPERAEPRPDRAADEVAAAAAAPAAEPARPVEVPGPPAPSLSPGDFTERWERSAGSEPLMPAASEPPNVGPVPPAVEAPAPPRAEPAAVPSEAPIGEPAPVGFDPRSVARPAEAPAPLVPERPIVTPRAEAEPATVATGPEPRAVAPAEQSVPVESPGSAESPARGWTPNEVRQARAPARAPASGPAPTGEGSPRPAEPTRRDIEEILAQPDETPASPSEWLSRLRRAFSAGESATQAGSPPAASEPTAEPMSLTNRAILTPLVGRDPGAVRLLRGGIAAKAVARVEADAVAVGDTILLGEGHEQSEPETAGLLAHELVHVGRRRSPRFVPPVVSAAPERPVGALPFALPLGSPSSAPAPAPAPVAPIGRRPAPSATAVRNAPPIADEEAVALDTEARATEIAETQRRLGSEPPQAGTWAPSSIGQPPARVEPSRSGAAPWGGLPPPWEPMPDFPTEASDVGGAPAGAIGLGGEGLGAMSGAVRRAPISREVPAPAAAPAGEAPGAPPVDVDALARQVYTILKRRLSGERRRAT
jgi:hypothetical protein